MMELVFAYLVLFGMLGVALWFLGGKRHYRCDDCNHQSGDYHYASQEVDGNPYCVRCGEEQEFYAYRYELWCEWLEPVASAVREYFSSSERDAE